MRGYCERHAAWGECDACVAEVIEAAPPDLQRMIRSSRRWDGLHRGLIVAAGVVVFLACLVFRAYRELVIWGWKP